MNAFQNLLRENRWHSFLLAVVLAVITSGSLPADEPGLAGANHKKMVNIEDYLFVVGRDHKLRFTFELVNRKRGETELHQIDVANVEIPQEIATPELIRLLNESFPAFRFVASKHDPQVVHAIDKRLDQLSGYALSQKATLKFSGTPQGLVRKLHESIPHLGPRESGSFRQAFDDDSSQIKVEGKQEELRQLLTSGGKWEKYGPCIWISQTALDTKMSIVQFYGPKFPN